MKTVELWGYTFYDDGSIYTKNKKKLKPRKQLQLVIKGETRRFSYARLVYYAFNLDNFDMENKNMIIIHKNGNKADFKLSNLVAVEKKSILQGENNSTCKLTNEQVEEIKRIYADNKTTYRELAKIYEVSHSLIGYIVRGKVRNENNYIL